VAGKVVGKLIAHRFDDCDEPFYIGRVDRQVTGSPRRGENGRYATSYVNSDMEFFHDLYPEDYGPDKMWVIMHESTPDPADPLAVAAAKRG
jgi:hypothetical protein